MTIAVPILYNVNSELPKSGRIFTENVKIENGSCNFKKNGVSYRKRRHTLFRTFGYMGILNEDVPKDYFWNIFLLHRKFRKNFPCSKKAHGQTSLRRKGNVPLKRTADVGKGYRPKRKGDKL